MLFAGLSCAALSGAKPNSIAAARKVVVLFNTFMCMVASPFNCIHDNRRKRHGGGADVQVQDLCALSHLP
jgi:hypothetical protein